MFTDGHWNYQIFKEVFYNEVIMFYPNIFGFSDFLQNNFFLRVEMGIFTDMENTKDFLQFVDFR